MTQTADVDIPKLIELCRAGLAWTAIGERMKIANSTAMKYWERHRTVDDQQARHDALDERGRFGRLPDRKTETSPEADPGGRFADDPRAKADIGSLYRLPGREPLHSPYSSSAAWAAGMA